MAVKVVTLPAITVVTPGQSVPLYSAKLLVYSVSIQSLSTNTGTQYIGDKTVDSSNGQAFTPSDVAELDGPASPKGQEEFDVSHIYVDSSTASAEFRVSVWTRE